MVMAKELYSAVLQVRGGHRLEVEGSLKMREYLEWVRADSTGNSLLCFTFLAKLIKAWDYTTEKDGQVVALDPKDLTAYGELDVMDYKVVAKAVSDWLKRDPDEKN